MKSGRVRRQQRTRGQHLFRRKNRGRLLLHQRHQQIHPLIGQLQHRHRGLLRLRPIGRRQLQQRGLQNRRRRQLQQRGLQNRRRRQLQQRGRQSHHQRQHGRRSHHQRQHGRRSHHQR